MSDLLIRQAAQADLPALLAIYNHYVRTTPATFDVEAITLPQRQRWLNGFAPSGRYRCFVAELGGIAIGYTCSGKFKEKAAYATSIQTSVYCAPSYTGRGIGRRLYSTLLEGVRSEDIHRAYAGITLPNEASVGLHKAMGFRLVGIQREAGRKFGKFWDVALYERET